MEPKPNFEASLEELEQLVGALDRGETSLDDALALYERGVRLLSHCHGLLEGAERTVALLSGVDADGNPKTVAFDATATADREPSTVEPLRRPRSRRASPKPDEPPC